MLWPAVVKVQDLAELCKLAQHWGCLKGSFLVMNGRGAALGLVREAGTQAWMVPRLGSLGWRRIFAPVPLWANVWQGSRHWKWASSCSSEHLDEASWGKDEPAEPQPRCFCALNAGVHGEGWCWSFPRHTTSPLRARCSAFLSLLSPDDTVRHALLQFNSCLSPERPFPCVCVSRISLWSQLRLKKIKIFVYGVGGAVCWLRTAPSGWKEVQLNLC